MARLPEFRADARWAALALLVMGCCLALLAVVLGYANGLDLSRALASFLVSAALAAVSFGVVGALIASRRPQHRLGWLFCIAGVGAGMQAFVGQYARTALLGPGSPLPGGDLAVWVNRWIFVIGLAVPLIYALLLFPSGRMLSHNWRWIGWLIGLWAVTYTVLLAFNPDPVPGLLLAGNPFGSELVRDVLGPGLSAGAVGGALAVGCGLVSLVLRFRSARGDERQQLRWFAFGTAVLAAALAVRPVLLGARLDTPELLVLSRAGEALALQSVPVAAGIAILRHRLYDIDILIRRTLVYGVLTVSLGLLYWTSVIVLQQLVRPFIQGSELAVVASTVAVATVFQPMRRRIQQTVDRRFYRSRYDGQRTLETFAAQARDQVHLEDLSAELLSVVQRTLRPAGTRLWLRPRSTRRWTP